MGRPVNFDSPLPDGDLTQKLHNKLYDVHNNNNNVLEIFREVYRLCTRRTARLAAGGPVSGELLYTTYVDTVRFPHGTRLLDSYPVIFLLAKGSGVCALMTLLQLTL